MKSSLPLLSIPVFLFWVIIGCESSGRKPDLSLAKKSPEVKFDTESPRAEPNYITVQHCLIGFKGSLPGKSVTRSKEEARELAMKLFDEAKGGADFEKMIRKYTDDSPPGIYKMANRGIKAEKGVYPRDGMVAAFGDTGFPLKVGDFGIAEFEPKSSPFGWHIVKRIE